MLLASFSFAFSDFHPYDPRKGRALLHIQLKYIIVDKF
jgi:hypothetical protein